MPDTLGRLMFDFAARVRWYRNYEMARAEVAAGLTERDLAILDFVQAKGSATFAEISRHLNMSNLPQASASTISQTISALFVEHHLVEKRQNPQDQRQPIVTLTEKGKDIVEQVRQVRVKMLTQVKTSMELSDTEAMILEKAFTKGIENFDKILAQV